MAGRKVNLPARQVPAQSFDANRRQNPAQIRDGACKLYDLEIGDAGAGYQRLKHYTIFSRLFDNVPAATLNPMTRMHLGPQDPPSQAPIDQCRYRLFNVKFWGQSLMRMGADGDELFFPDRTQCGPTIPNQQVPTPLKGWIQTEDGMYQTFDILGRRNFEVYALHVQAGFLAPDASYIVENRPRDGSKDEAYDGIVDQSCVGVTISEVVVNSTQHEDSTSICASLPGVVGSEVLVPIPPGSRRVCFTPGVFVGIGVAFSWNPTTAAFKGQPDQSVSAELITNAQSRPLCIPGSPFIRLTRTAVFGSATPVCMTFEQEL